MVFGHKFANTLHFPNSAPLLSMLALIIYDIDVIGLCIIHLRYFLLWKPIY